MRNLFFLSDLDSKYYSCVTLRKNSRLKTYDSLELDDIVIAKEEIESWFLAGVNVNNKYFNEFKIPSNTENITKEDFNDMFENSHFKSRNDFLYEISSNYDFNLAINRNKSFKYFIDKLKKVITR